MDRRRLKFAIAFAVIAGGLAFLIGGKLKDAFRYSESVAAVAQGGDALLGRPLRIQGKYVDDSLRKKRDGGKPYFEFQVHEGGSKITLRYDDVLPDTLVNGAEVTAEGSRARPGYFQATKVFAKCPSKYEAATVPAGYRPPDPYSPAGRSAPESLGPPRPPSAARSPSAPMP